MAERAAGMFPETMGAPASSDVLIVDDEEANRVSYERALTARGYTCAEADSAARARALLGQQEFRLVLLDINLGSDSGLDLLTEIRTTRPTTAVVMVTGIDDPNLAMKAIEMGAYGYMVKPVRVSELIINVANALYRRSAEAEHRRAMNKLEDTIKARTSDLVGALDDLQHSQAETILRLAKLVEFRDEDTGRHVERMSHYCGLLARKVGMDDDKSWEVQLASQLHDVGKVSIPDGILFKPGKLAAAEMEVMKGHALAGYRMLTNSASNVIQIGADIAHTHHERWDGSGYPQQLAGDRIPLEGRIAAVADVFDALTSRRPYRSAFPVGTAIDMMGAQRGKHFDPAILNTFLRSMKEVEVVRQQYED
jgi:cyclic di-GMP phosphodiesterase